MDIGVLTALIGGALALLSPCGALLLPAFFASTVGSGPRLWAHGALFYVGLAVVLVPLGLGAGALGAVFATHRGIIITVASLLMILLGVLQIIGIGFDPARFVPGAETLQHHAHTSTGWIKTFLLGAASGVAGLCAGPILGAVLTLAAAQNDVFSAGGLLAVYAAGMVIPLLVLASVWKRLGQRGRKVLRGRAFTVWGKELHTTSVLTGVLIVGVGVLFWVTNGLVTLPELLPASMSAWVQERAAVLSNPVVDLVLFLAVAGLVLFWWIRRRVRAAALSAPVEEET